MKTISQELQDKFTDILKEKFPGTRDQLQESEMRFEVCKMWTNSEADEDNPDYIGFVIFFIKELSKYSEKGKTVQFPIIFSIRDPDLFTEDRFEEIVDKMNTIVDEWVDLYIDYEAGDDYGFPFYYLKTDGTLTYAFEKFNEDVEV